METPRPDAVLIDDDSAEDADDPTPEAAAPWAGHWAVVTEGATITQSVELWSFADEALPLAPWARADGLPVLGASAIPGVHAPLPEGEGCSPLDSVDLAAPPIGGALDLSFSLRADDATVVDAAGLGGHHLWVGESPSTSRWSVRPPAAPEFVDAAFDAPAAPSSVLPLSGPVGGLATLNFSWEPEPSSGLEILLLRHPNQQNPMQWSAVRCLFADDGSASVDASSLAAAGTGDVFVYLSRSRRVVGDGVETLSTRTTHLRLWPTR